MTKVDFYVLSDENADNRLMLVCKLTEKAYRYDQKVFIHSDEKNLLAELDNVLWQFRADSFVPHTFLDETDASVEHNMDPVQLSIGEPGHDRCVLINLSNSVPPFFSRFERTLEVINQSETVRVSARERYRFYQQRGYPLQHHKM